MLDARELSLDCGPISGFDKAKIDAEFFPGETVKLNFLCDLGYGDASKLHPHTTHGSRSTKPAVLARAREAVRRA